ncbi:MAG: alpha/beta hydrolase [Spirochaetaceae bacterium]|nr:alpha/beta hydrolase [Spirochaetaceae bacterium]
MNTDDTRQKIKRNIAGRVLAIMLGIAVVSVLGFVGWTRVSRYEAFPDAVAVAREARTPQGWYVFRPAGKDGTEPDTGFIFYPGGLVDPAAYAPLMRQLADAGLLVVLTPMPLDLAIFGVDAAANVMAAHHAISHWILGGHSLGGAMAAEFVKKHPELTGGTSDESSSDTRARSPGAALEGLVLLASYPASSTDLSALPLKVLSIYGSEDGVASRDFEQSLQRLPADTTLVRLEGGNHAQFGNYGPQKGDGQATIERARQQSMTVEAIIELAARINK